MRTTKDIKAELKETLADGIKYAELGLVPDRTIRGFELQHLLKKLAQAYRNEAKKTKK